jgi:hypothetical protein
MKKSSQKILLFLLNSIFQTGLPLRLARRIEGKDKGIIYLYSRRAHEVKS